MSNFSHRHVATAMPGGAAFIAGHAYTVGNRPRGLVAVYDDGEMILYRVSRSERGEFRRWAEYVFSGANGNKLKGAWPEYTVCPVY